MPTCASTSPRPAWRVLLVVALASMLFSSTAPAALAHAAFVSSRPQPGTQLQAAPGAVEITFSEPLIPELSSLTVTDPEGQTWEHTGVGERSMRATLDTNTHGVYEVAWKTVSPIDGHTLRGSFRFGVGVTPEDVEPAAGIEPRTPDVLLATARAVEYAGLLTAVGMLLVARLGSREPALAWVRLRPTRPLVAALGAAAVVVGGEALLAAPSASAAAVVRYLQAEPGVPRLARLVAEGAGLVALHFHRRRLAALAIGGALVALAAGGHAAAAQPAWWGIAVDAAHVLAAGLWAGAILALATLRPPEGWRGEEARELLARFSPVAAWAFLATVAFGSLRGVQELVGLGDLVRTSYGQVLALKVLTVALMVPLSLRAWRRREARPAAEGLLAVAAIAAAALLAAYPVPPQRVAEDVEAGVSGTNPALPREGDLTLGGHTGDVLVGLTLRPGRPGRNDVFAYLLPLEGEEEAGDLSAQLLAGDVALPLESCGATCRRTSTVVESGQTLQVAVGGVDDAPATFTLPDLPAPDGQDLLDRLTARMAALRSLRYEEVFGPVEPPIRSSVDIVAPDRIRVVIHTYNRETVRIGDLFYRRQGGQPWQVEKGPQLRVPVYIWDYPGRVGVRIVGEEQLEGAPTRIVSFFVDLESTPIWYRLWVDDEGLVRRAAMRAQGHFMDHDYFDFNAPITIRPPVPEGEITDDVTG